MIINVKEVMEKWKEREDLTGYHALLIIGTFVSIYLMILLYGKYEINILISMIPVVLWIGGYELSKKLNKGKTR